MRAAQVEGIDTQLIPACLFALQRDVNLTLSDVAILTTVQMVPELNAQQESVRMSGQPFFKLSGKVAGRDFFSPTHLSTHLV